MVANTADRDAAWNFVEIMTQLGKGDIAGPSDSDAGEFPGFSNIEEKDGLLGFDFRMKRCG
jgi:hypothetical protein